MATYPKFIQSALDDKLSGATLKALLVDSTFTDSAAYQYLSDVSGHEIAASGYSRQTLTSVSVDYDPDVGVSIVCDDVNFGTFNASVRGPVFYIDTGTPSTSELLAADVDPDNLDVLTTAAAAIYRIDPSSGFVLAQF